jgi:hypothetical protein
MYGVSNDLPVDEFNGCQVLQICFGENEIIINFDGHKSILIMSKIKIENENIFEIENFLENSNTLNKLIGKKITDCSLIHCGIKLSFGSESISIIDDSAEFESFIISVGDKKYII